MEKHFLDDFVQELEQEFPMTEREDSPGPWYIPEGDCISYQISNEAVVADRIDSVLTIYRSYKDGRPIGYQIKGVVAMLKEFGRDTLVCRSVEDEKGLLSVRTLLLAAYEKGPLTIGRRRGYAEIQIFPADGMEFPSEHPEEHVPA